MDPEETYEAVVNGVLRTGLGAQIFAGRLGKRLNASDMFGRLRRSILDSQGRFRRSSTTQGCLASLGKM